MQNGWEEVMYIEKRRGDPRPLVTMNRACRLKPGCSCISEASMKPPIQKGRIEIFASIYV
jgi:hypothetical protein